MNRKDRGVLLKVFMVLTICLNKTGTAFAGEPKTIPFPAGYDTGISGAAAYGNSGDHKSTRYFRHPDFYRMKSDKNLTILSGFKTYQQTTEWSCGPSAALMVLYHYGRTGWDESAIEQAMHKRNPAGDSAGRGTSTEEIVEFFKALDWRVASSITEGKLPGGKTFEHAEEFRDWVIRNLKENTPVMVEFIDWGGHWLDIIGYDTMGTDSVGDDVIVFADPYDTGDHLQDGYYIYPAERFYYMWFDAFILREKQSRQQWVIAEPYKD
ncbi:MAG: C39 family peptidase [Bacillota bacterium]|nr:C39 family peptidase [Bacillota bacterium]